jgi:hypothetical protein
MKLNIVLMIVVIFLAALSPIQMMSMLVSILGIHVSFDIAYIRHLNVAEIVFVLFVRFNCVSCVHFDGRR